MREVNELNVRAGVGIEGDLPASSHRAVTLLSSEHWRQTCAELGKELPWHTRRANVLVEAGPGSLSGGGLGPWIGQAVRIGEVGLQIEGETKPCALMDRLHAGLRAALAPDVRAGVHGRVTCGGRIRVGDLVTLVR